MGLPYNETIKTIEIVSPFILLNSILLFNALAQADITDTTLTIPTYTNADRQLIREEAAQAVYDIAHQQITTISNEPKTSMMNIYPITTTSMTVGNVAQQTISAPTLAQPIFLIGVDEVSTQWLKQHREKLKNLHAIGFLIQVQNQTEFEAIKTLAEELPLIPVSGNVFSQRFKLEHYPVLITQRSIQQVIE